MYHPVASFILLKIFIKRDVKRILVCLLGLYGEDLLELFISSLTVTAQKKKISIEDSFSKCDQIRSTADFVAFTEEILN